MTHSNRHYLCVDDNPDFLENLSEILSSQGARVDSALNGAELLAQLRQLDPEVPVVLLSAWSDGAALKQARRNGLLASVSKTSQVPQLLELLLNARRGLVLVVEDDEALLENLSEALAPHGYTVVPASSVGEVDTLPVTPQAALVDLAVPGGAVGEALKHVRARFPRAQTVVITALLDEGSASQGAEVFRKPFNTADLVRRVEELVRVAS